ncbi:MAG: DUF4388 domain-containing protein [Gemmatimonadaceae bacterium]
MAIEGPLRELGIHDVFQLLDLSRKTGTLRVTSDLRDDEGIVHFDAGKIVRATMRSQPSTLESLLLRSGRVTADDIGRAQAHGDGRPLGEQLVRDGVISRRELDRQLRLQVESVVFELMSWREGFFSFEESAPGETIAHPEIRLATESLLMEGARRIDEWSRIAHKIPSLAVIPSFAPVGEEHAPQLDLLPHEWEVLSSIDGTRDLRAIAGALSRGEFEVAKVVYGLVTTGVVQVRTPERRSSGGVRITAEAEDRLAEAHAALASGDAEAALTAATAARALDPARVEARRLMARALSRLARHADALEELRRAALADPMAVEVHRDLGFAAARVGEFSGALASWEHYLRTAPPGDGNATAVMQALDAVRRTVALLEAQLHE